MYLITSAAYITPGLSSEFGKIPPCMLPVQNRRLYEHQISIIPDKENIILSLPYSYQLTAYDNRRLTSLGVRIVKVPDDLSLGQSIVYVLNVVGQYSESLTILHGDTLFSNLLKEPDSCAIAIAEDFYDWAHVGEYDNVYAGCFSFSDQSLLIQKITESEYKFMEGVAEYGRVKPLHNTYLENWMDFGLVNTYYRSISKMTTQRVFNSMKVSQFSVRKSSLDKRKMKAESNWILSLPASMKHYAPPVWDRGDDGNYYYYEIEYYFLSSLANLFVFGKNELYVWKDIIRSCVDFFDEEFEIKPVNVLQIAQQNDLLYSSKTMIRLEQYAKQTNISLDEPWIINGVRVPSLNNIIKEIEPAISKADVRFATMMHGDPCFSNILYDFKSKSIKVIDPRGMDIDGKQSIYGDIRYDVAKLAHSILGMYDFIIGGMFEYGENDKYNVYINFEMSDNLEQIQSFFLQQKIGGYSLSELSVYPILIHLFLSMLPLHNDYVDRQKAFLANALRLYVEFIKK